MAPTIGSLPSSPYTLMSPNSSCFSSTFFRLRAASRNDVLIVRFHAFAKGSFAFELTDFLQWSLGCFLSLIWAVTPSMTLFGRLPLTRNIIS
ncbi:unnamed protein product [Chondrus crispus]|uniref:Uncharacterized protein n=1 Tax=Chondrus crispus TaxID=2769 RepID=R7Q483_CHOCR|nr:unnamed protein product [Chondrus crispus]CDF32683.1 unnamed protein product [Chondrus crispus]|eukprot:XP_005712454.1 unnamed protein product [Chondrus crispus]